MSTTDLEIHPLTEDRWQDLVDLFGPERGASSGCWCMWPFLRGRDWKALTREERRDGFHDKVLGGPPPGLLSNQGGLPVGWVALGPRENYVRFQLAENSAPLETDTAQQLGSTFAVTCFFMRRGYRKAGQMSQLLQAAVDHAAGRGASHVDACPIDPEKPLQWGEGFVGIASVFRKCGFEEIARRSPRRPLVRKTL